MKVAESGDASEGSLLLPSGGGSPGLEQAAGAGKAEQSWECAATAGGDGRTKSPGLMLEMLCELLAAGSWAGRKEQPARTWWVGKVIINPFLFLLITLFISSLFDCRFELSSFQKGRK